MTAFEGTLRGVREQKLEGRISPIQKALPTVEELVKLLALRQPQPYGVLRALCEAISRLEARRKEQKCAVAAPLRGDRFNYAQEVRVSVVPGDPSSNFADLTPSVRDGFAGSVTVSVFAEVVYTEGNKQMPRVLVVTVDAVALESDTEEAN